VIEIGIYHQWVFLLATAEKGMQRNENPLVHSVWGRCSCQTKNLRQTLPPETCRRRVVT